MIADAATLWQALPLPALLLDAAGRLAALNGAAEAWLNLSRRAVLGRSVAALAEDGRLMVDPPLASLAARATAGNGAIVHPEALITLDARAQTPVTRRATIHASPAPGGGLAALLVPEAAGDTPPRGDVPITRLADAVEAQLRRYFDLHGTALPPAGLHARVLAEVERPLIEVTLDATGGNQLRAADLLGINRNTLRKKVAALNIDVTRRPRLM